MTFLAALRCDRLDRAMRLRWSDQWPMLPRLLWISNSSPPSNPAISWLWTIWAATNPRPLRKAIRAVGARLLFLPPYSPRSQSHRADLRQGQTLDASGPEKKNSKIHGATSDTSSAPSSPMNVTTTSKTPATLPSKRGKPLGLELRSTINPQLGFDEAQLSAHGVVGRKPDPTACSDWTSQPHLRRQRSISKWSLYGCSGAAECRLRDGPRRTHNWV